MNFGHGPQSNPRGPRHTRQTGKDVNRLPRQTKEMDMLSGPLGMKIIRFALPIAASSFLQQLFNAADTAVVGRFAGSDSLAAVGGNSAVITLMVNLFVGFSVGTNVMMANCRGRLDEDGMVKTLHTSMLVGLLSGLFFLVAGTLLAETAHALLGTGEEGSFLRRQAVAYFRIYFLGAPFITLYNTESAILRSKGDTRRPLLVLSAAGVLNLLLNLLFVIVFGMRAEGVALATVLSNALSSMTLLFFLLREEGPYRLRRERLRLDRQALQGIVRVGLPAGIQSSMFAIANVMLQTFVNALGQAAIAGTTVGLNAEYFGYDVFNGFSQASTTFVGQNYGAGNLPRCRRVTRLCLLYGIGFTLIVGILLAVFRRGIVSLFTAEAMVAEIACIRFVRVGLFQAVDAVGEIFSGSMRGMKRSLLPAVISMLSICGVRLTWAYVFYPARHTYEYLVLAYPLSWTISMVAMGVAYCFVRARAEKQRRVS